MHADWTAGFCSRVCEIELWTKGSEHEDTLVLDVASHRVVSLYWPQQDQTRSPHHLDHPPFHLQACVALHIRRQWGAFPSWRTQAECQVLSLTRESFETGQASWKDKGAGQPRGSPRVLSGHSARRFPWLWIPNRSSGIKRTKNCRSSTRFWWFSRAQFTFPDHSQNNHWLMNNYTG